MPDRLLDVKTACQRLGGISRPTFYKYANSGELATITLGRRRFVPESELTSFIGRQLTGRKSGDAA